MYTGISGSRVTSTIMSSNLYGALQRTQLQMLDAQQQITSGKQIAAPSDQPGRVSVVQFLQQRLADRGQTERNLSQASAMLDNIDVTLGEATNLVIDAATIASSQVGVGSDAATRRTEAAVIASQIDSLVNLANRQYNNISLFGGRNGAAAGGVVFESFLGGVRYVGHEGRLGVDTGASEAQAFNSNGVDAFGALSSRVKSQVNLQPQADATTRLADVRGADMQGFLSGVVRMDVDGVRVDVDLANADTLGDVATRLNHAIDSLAPGAGSVALAGQGFELTATAGHTIEIADLGTARTAASLGLDITASGATTAGDSVHPKLTPQTRIASLGASVDWTSGIQVQQGGHIAVLDFSGAQTVQDLINEVQRHNLGLRLSIDATSGQLSMVSEVSGVEMAIGENGGSTATDLGLRSLDRETSLDLFRRGLGVETEQGFDDLKVQLHDGSAFRVNLDGVHTVGEMMDRVILAADSAGIAPGNFSVGMAAVGNGLEFQDHTTGTEDFRIDAVDQSQAALHLGIAQNAQNGDVIALEDTAKVRVENVFTHLMDLRDSLLNNDSIGITVAGERLQTGVDRITQARSLIGVDARRVTDAIGHSQSLKVTEEKMLSDVQDADLTEMIMKFTQLQQQLQASMKVGTVTLQTSFLDYMS